MFGPPDKDGWQTTSLPSGMKFRFEDSDTIGKYPTVEIMGKIEVDDFLMFSELVKCEIFRRYRQETWVEQLVDEVCGKTSPLEYERLAKEGLEKARKIQEVK